MVATLDYMATDKPKRGRPPGRTPTHTIHTGIDVEIGAALMAYMNAQPYHPRLKEVTERAFVAFLTKEGYWPIPEPKGRKKHAAD